MNKLTFKYVLLFIFMFSIVTFQGNAQIFKKNPEKQLFGKTNIKKKAPKVRERRSVVRAKKQQEANERQLKKESAIAVKKSRKRTYDIQSPDVQERMKQNQKDLAVRDKKKHKKVNPEAKKARKKYD
jgi:hypothetical protein